jgi:membrane protease YdiL (CAAX protease family)
MTYPRAFSDCQWRLASVWLGGSAVILAIFLVQIAGRKFGGQEERAWAWLLPNVVPVLTMIGGAVSYQVSRPRVRIEVNRFAYLAALALSMVYLFILLLILLLIPMAEGHGTSPIDWVVQAQVPITALSAIVGATLGAFFVSSKPSEGDAG